VTLQDRTTSSVTTEYYRDGRVKSVTDPRGVTSYTYDGQGREEKVVTSAGETRKTYYPDALVKDISFPNLTKRAHGYDKADRLLSIVTTKDAATVTSTAYTYDPNGNRLTQVQANGAGEETTTYTYDDLDRLATVTYPADVEHPNGRTVTYGHDGAGNRETEVVTDPQTQGVLESKTGHFDNANRLTELTDNLDAAQTTTLAWDRNGNLLSETKAGVTTSYRYDLRDTLAEVERGGQTLARFLGDFDERRVLKIGDPTRPGGSGVQEYLYNGSRLVLDVENGQPTARYEWTNEELVSLLQNGGARRYFALDGLETVLALTDEQGQATDRLNFDAWGVPKEGTDFGTSGNRFAFTSHRFDTELDLYYAGGRMYSPTIGRFISQDTLSLDPNNPDSWNPFAYARSNPTRYVDPTGHGAACPEGATCISATEPSTGGLVRGGLVYGAETVAEFVSPVPLGLSDPDTTIHPLASTAESSSWLTGDNQISADYAAFKERYGRGAQVVEGAAVAKYGGKVGKVVGLVMIAGAMMHGKPEISGTQGEDGNFGPDGGNREPLPAQKEQSAQSTRTEPRPVKPGEMTAFEDFDARSVKGDQLEGHEPLQHAILKREGKAQERLSTEASRKNPVVALEKSVHAEVNKAQRLAKTAEMPVPESIKANIDILIEKAKVNRHAAEELLSWVTEHAREIGLLKKK